MLLVLLVKYIYIYNNKLFVCLYVYLFYDYIKSTPKHLVNSIPVLTILIMDNKARNGIRNFPLSENQDRKRINKINNVVSKRLI